MNSLWRMNYLLNKLWDKSLNLLTILLRNSICHLKFASSWSELKSYKTKCKSNSRNSENFNKRTKGTVRKILVYKKYFRRPLINTTQVDMITWIYIQRSLRCKTSSLKGKKFLIKKAKSFQWSDTKNRSMKPLKLSLGEEFREYSRPSRQLIMSICKNKKNWQTFFKNYKLKSTGHSLKKWRLLMRSWWQKLLYSKLERSASC